MSSRNFIIRRARVMNLPEPLIRCTDETGKMAFDIFNIIESSSERIMDINNDDFPIRLALIKEGHDAKDLDLLDLANVAYLLANLTNIQRVIVTFGFRLGVCGSGIFPCL